MGQGTVEAFGMVAGAFVGSESVVGIFDIVGGGDGCAGLYGCCPFALEVHQCGQVGFDGLLGVLVDFAIAQVFVHILVGQASDGVA